MSEKLRKKVNDIEVNKENYEMDQKAKGPKFGSRHVQVVLLCLAFIFGIGTRNNLSVAIVAMTDNTTSPNPDVPAYEWNNTSLILSSFFWSYVTIQVIAGYLGKTYGPKYFLLVSFLINCTTCALTPLAAAQLGSGGVILCRLIQGFSQGFLYPSIHAMLGTWVPDQERTTLGNVIFSGVGLGSIYASMVTGYISASWWGWQYSFYILAALGYLWTILWGIFGQNSPAVHPTITPEEKRYIQNSLKQEDDVHLPIPWKQILTCVPFYTLIIAHIGNAFAYAIVATEIPSFLGKVMNFDVKSNAVISAIPIAFGLLASFVTGPLSDWIIANQYLSTLNCRKIFHVIGSWGQAACLLPLSFLADANAYVAVTLLALAYVFAACVLVGGSINHLDLSPRFAGVMFAILNSAAQVSSISATLVAQWVITDMSDITQWRIIFIMAAAFFGVGSFTFLFFASATRQAWDGPENKKLQERRKKISVISFSGA